MTSGGAVDNTKDNGMSVWAIVIAILIVVAIIILIIVLVPKKKG